MRAILHAIAIAAVVVAFIVLEPAIRTGRISIFGGMFALAVVLVASYVVIVAILGLMSGRPLAQWLAIARQLFSGHSQR